MAGCGDRQQGIGSAPGRFTQVDVEFREVGGELSSAEGGYVALRVDVEGRVIALMFCP